MRRVAAALLVALSTFGGQVSAADTAVVACKVTDERGGSNQLVFELQDDRIQSFRYRRSEGLPRCEIEASRSPSAYSWERSEWIDSSDRIDVRTYSDGTDDAHVQIIRRDSQIELRIIGYNRSWLCGLGQYLHPAIALRRGEEHCILDP